MFPLRPKNLVPNSLKEFKRFQKILSFLRETTLTGFPYIDVKARAYYSGLGFE